MKLNFPNKLTLMRLVMVPVYVLLIILPLPGVWSNILGGAAFILTALTDMADGIAARRMNMVTDFGKFLDPIADKFMIFGAMLAILVKYGGVLRQVFLWVSLVVILRELAVTSMKLAANQKDGTVIAANWPAKLKTISQTVCISTILLEPAVLPNAYNVLSYATMAVMTALTIYSGYRYFRDYRGVINIGQ